MVSSARKRVEKSSKKMQAKAAQTSQQWHRLGATASSSVKCGSKGEDRRAHREQSKGPFDSLVGLRTACNARLDF